MSAEGIGINSKEPDAAAAPLQPPTDRASRLFRHSLRAGSVHPLLPLLRAHFGETGPLVMPPSSNRAERGAAPRAPLSQGDLQHAARSLPSLPRVVHEALRAMQDERLGSAVIAERLACDPALTARTLRAANTAFYGVSGRVATVQTAIAVLGLSSVAALLTAAAASSLFRVALGEHAFDLHRFSRHSVTSAALARGLAARAGLDPDLAFIAALLHDVGDLALASAFPAEHGLAHRHARDADLPLLEAERAVLGTDHVEAGVLLAHRWHLPNAIAEVIAHHHASTAQAGLPALVQVADALAYGLGDGDDMDAVPDMTVAAWTGLALDIDDCRNVLRECAGDIESLCQVLLP